MRVKILISSRDNYCVKDKMSKLKDFREAHYDNDDDDDDDDKKKNLKIWNINRLLDLPRGER